MSPLNQDEGTLMEVFYVFATCPAQSVFAFRCHGHYLVFYLTDLIDFEFPLCVKLYSFDVAQRVYLRRVCIAVWSRG